MVANGIPALTAGSHEEPGTSNQNGHGTLRRIEAAYSDNPVVDTDEEDLSSRSLEVSANRGGNNGPVVQPSRLHDENNEWAR